MIAYIMHCNKLYKKSRDGFIKDLSIFLHEILI
jgi:hypothetical protein